MVPIPRTGYLVMNALARILAAVLRAMRGGWSFLSDAFDEAVSPLTKRIPWLQDRARAAGRALDRGVSATADAAAVTAEVALRAPGAIGRELGSVVGSMLPAPQITGRALAESAVATDEEIQRIVEAAAPGAEFERQRPRPGFGTFLQHAVEAYRDGGEKGLAPHVRWVSEPAAQWIRVLSHSQIEAALAMAPEALRRHVMPEKEADVSPLLPQCLAIGSAPKIDPVIVTEEEQARIIAEAKRNLWNSGAEVAAMMKRGPSAASARPEPRFDAMPDEMPRYTARAYRPRGAY